MSNEICGQCEHFSDQNAPNIAQGEGRCLGYGDQNPEPLVAWDHRATVLFGPIKDRVRKDKRIAWLVRMKEAANAAPAASAGPPTRQLDHAATSPPTHTEKRLRTPFHENEK